MEKMSYGKLRNMGREMLRSAGVPDAEYDSLELLLHIFDISRSEYFLNADKQVSPEKYIAAVKKRSGRYPLQYITGEQWFMNYRFEVNEDVLIPRQDTEILVAKAAEIIEGIEKENVNVLDMCTGSGCIAVSLALMCKNANLTAADISENALKTARKNSLKNGAHVEFLHSNLFEEIRGKYDVIVSNPPYIPTEDIAKLMPEVGKHEPVMALDGDRDGLKFYRDIAGQAPAYFDGFGKILFEIGCDQAEDVTGILAEIGYADIEVYEDFAGLDRVVSAFFDRNGDN